MNRARGVFWLYAALALPGAGVTVLALVAAAANVRFGVASVDVLIAACQRLALPEVTVTSVAALMLGSGAFAVLLLGARSAFRQVGATRRFVASLDVLGPAPVGPPGTFVFADDTANAFCAGLLRPRIFVSTGTLATLGHDELQAVLAHEHHHARLRDPRAAPARADRPGRSLLPSRHAAARRALRGPGGGRRRRRGRRGE